MGNTKARLEHYSEQESTVVPLGLYLKVHRESVFDKTMKEF